MTDTRDDERLMGLEETVMHHERKIEDLSEVITRQWEMIDRMAAQIKAMQSHVVRLESGGRDAKSEEGLSPTEIAALNRPPHY